MKTKLGLIAFILLTAAGCSSEKDTTVDHSILTKVTSPLTKMTDGAFGYANLPYNITIVVSSVVGETFPITAKITSDLDCKLFFDGKDYSAGEAIPLTLDKANDISITFNEWSDTFINKVYLKYYFGAEEIGGDEISCLIALERLSISKLSASLKKDGASVSKGPILTPYNLVINLESLLKSGIYPCYTEITSTPSAIITIDGEEYRDTTAGTYVDLNKETDNILFTPLHSAQYTITVTSYLLGKPEKSTTFTFQANSIQ